MLCRQLREEPRQEGACHMGCPYPRRCKAWPNTAGKHGGSSDTSSPMCGDQMMCPPTCPTTRCRPTLCIHLLSRARRQTLRWRGGAAMIPPSALATAPALLSAMQPLLPRPHPSPRRLSQDCAFIVWGGAGRNHEGEVGELCPCADEAMRTRTSRSTPGTEGREGRGDGVLVAHFLITWPWGSG